MNAERVPHFESSMRKLILFFLLCYATAAWSIPAKKEWRIYQQPDGTSIELMLVGDEYFHFYVTRDDVPVVEESGCFYYARVSGTALLPTSVLAHEVQRRTAEDKQHIISIEEVKQLPHQRMQIPRTIGDTDHPAYTGSKKGLIILANFSNKTFEGYDDDPEQVRQRYDDMANLPGYTNEWGAIGSVHDYYTDQSYGQFDLTFDVIGPVNLAKTNLYYGKNSPSTDFAAPEMIMECCAAVDSLVDFTIYDWDGDGVVEEVFVLYAGYGEATGGGAATIWPHMSSLKAHSQYNTNIPEEVVHDGVQIDVYACSNELYRSGRPMGIGVICHEFSHCLGLPDMYDTSDSKNFGMDKWDILSDGGYNGPEGVGWVPAGYTSYERNFAGWLDYTVLHNDTTVSDMHPLNEGTGEAYIIYNDNAPDEYYLLENRHQSRWDAYLPGEGLLITHIDYDEDIWRRNKVNATGYGAKNDHQRLTIFHASNTISYGHDAYPYEGNDSLTDYSEPAAMLYNANYDGTYLMHKPITSITHDEETGSVSFIFANKNEKNRVENTMQVEDEEVTVYHLNGIKMVEALRMSDISQLPKGYYLLRGKSTGKTIKKKVE